MFREVQKATRKNGYPKSQAGAILGRDEGDINGRRVINGVLGDTKILFYSMDGVALEQFIYLRICFM